MNARTTIYRRFAGLVFSLITVLGLLFITITYLATTYYHDAGTQLLNKEVAAHIATFTSPFEEGGINRQKADSVFYNAMVLSPSAEVYFLDTAGSVVAFHSSEKELLQEKVSVAPIKKFIATKGGEYVRGTDPREPGHEKIFSAAAVQGGKGLLGYIYVILGSKKSEGIMEVIFGSHALGLAIKAFLLVLLLSFLISLLYLNRLRKNYGQMIGVLERFESGDYGARFTLKKNNELAPVMQAFNKMADLLSSSINKLTTSEEARKTFIATISHDLRTPLAIARGYTEVLTVKEKSGLTPELKEQYVQLIYTKLLQIENMVKQLFELSKMEAVEFTPQKEPFVLSEIVQEAVATFGGLAREKGVSLKCTQCLYHVWVNADISMMERVVQNLVDNALKSTPEGGSVQAAMAVEGAGLLFKIENTGPPLPDDLLQWINGFDDDEKGLGQRPQKLGLGLTIVQKILRLHHTSLKASHQNGSNLFTFRLPVYQMPAGSGE